MSLQFIEELQVAEDPGYKIPRRLTSTGSSFKGCQSLTLRFVRRLQKAISANILVTMELVKGRDILGSKYELKRFVVSEAGK